MRNSRKITGPRNARALAFSLMDHRISAGTLGFLSFDHKSFPRMGYNCCPVGMGPEPAWRCRMFAQSLLTLLSRVLIVSVVVSLSSVVAWSGSYTLLHVFLQNQEHPSSGLVVDAAGNAYGTTAFGGGKNNAGTVYQLSPTSGFHTIYAFTGPNGSKPNGSLLVDSAGNIYGTTTGGGAFLCDNDTIGCGIVYRLSPPKSGGPWTQTILYNFSGGDDGWYPYSGVISDSEGNLYGTALQGGPSQCGVVFELSPTGNDQWTQQVLHPLTLDGCNPAGGLVFDGLGNLYGTAETGGAWGWGTAFELSPSPDGNWTYSTIHDFNSDGTDGAQPWAGLILDNAGNLYGSTRFGGAFGFGIVFELMPDSGNWTESILHSFAGGNDGANLFFNLVFDSAGNLYGTTASGGGPKGYGTIFRLTPSQDDTWTESVFDMGSGVRGANPNGPVLLDGKGHAYGTASEGGRAKNGQIGYGVVFRLNIGNAPVAAEGPAANEL